MSHVVIENPVINSPFCEPTRHRGVGKGLKEIEKELKKPFK